MQDGVLSAAQLMGFLGWTRNQIRAQVDACRWQRVFPGVYAVTTGELAIHTLWWAAHLRCGEASALAGESTLQAWKILPATQPNPQSPRFAHRFRPGPRAD